MDLKLVEPMSQHAFCALLEVTAMMKDYPVQLDCVLLAIIARWVLHIQCHQMIGQVEFVLQEHIVRVVQPHQLDVLLARITI
jgi:hypothetical protein